MHATRPLASTVGWALVGLGGFGARVLTAFDQSNTASPWPRRIAVNTDAVSLQATPADLHIWLQPNVPAHRRATWPEVQKHALDTQAAVWAAIEGLHGVRLVAGLGGAAGTGATVAWASLLQSQPYFVSADVVRPFDFEGPDRTERADLAIPTLCALLGDALELTPNDDTLHPTKDDDTPIEVALMRGVNACLERSERWAQRMSQQIANA